jgi:predicted nucleic acid-binding protein
VRGSYEGTGWSSHRAAASGWEVADRLGWASTYNAEYVALTQLQADALVTLDAELARSVEGIVATASIDALR